MSKRQVAWLSTGLIALLWALLSLSCLSLSFIFALMPQPVSINRAGPVALLGMAGLSLVLAAGVLLAASSGFRNRPTRPWVPQRPWPIVLSLMVLAALVFSSLIPVRWQTSLGFAPLHAGLIIASALAILFAAAHAAGKHLAPTARQWWLTLGAGALSALPAIALELVAVLGIIFIVSLALVILPGGMEQLETWRAQLDQLRLSPQTASPDLVMEWLRSPFILAALALALGVVAPLVEEVCKTLVVSLLAWRERGASLTRAYLWGAACGAGFAMLEGIGNGASGLGTGTWWDWASGIATRVPASAMHMLVSGLVGLGWAYFWRGQRWRLPLFYLLAIGFHGLWNLMAVGFIGGSAFVSDAPLTITLPHGIVLLSMAGLGVLVLVALLVTPLLPLWLKRLDAPLIVPEPTHEPGDAAGAMAL